MPKLRVLSGRDVLRILHGFGFEKAAQRGGHIKVRRVPEGGRNQTLTIPNHDEIDRGTLYAIFRQACRFIPESDLHDKFFTD